MRPPDWTDQAKCGPLITKESMRRDPKAAEKSDGMFYSDEDSHISAITVGRRFCRGTDGTPRCPVIDECLEYAIENDERFGVWGGLSTRSRLRLIAARDRQRSTFG